MACLTVTWVFAVYLVVVVGGGLLLGAADRPNFGLSLLATGVVAVGIEPVRSALAARFAQSPYERLAQFATRATHTVATDDLASELARRVGEGSGAAAVEVWLGAGDTPPGTLVARWPEPGAAEADRGPTHAYPIRHGHDLLGELLVRERPGRPVEPVEQRLVRDLCAQAGVALRHVQLTQDLRRRIAESADRAAELRSSRQRVVAAADAERRRLERDIHDGAQQHLIALAINLALAREVLARSPARVTSLLSSLRNTVCGALAVLDELGRGIYPRELVEHGVAAALRAATATSALPVTIEDATTARYPREIEAAAYFSCLEAVQNAVKHSRGSQVSVRLETGPEGLELEVTDNGHGFDVEQAGAGRGTLHLRDRLDAAGGRVEVVSTPDTGTRVLVHLPVATAAAGVASS